MKWHEHGKTVHIRVTLAAKRLFPGLSFSLEDFDNPFRAITDVLLDHFLSMGKPGNFLIDKNSCNRISRLAANKESNTDSCETDTTPVCGNSNRQRCKSST